jgi:hypothetical protein
VRFFETVVTIGFRFDLFLFARFENVNKNNTHKERERENGVDLYRDVDVIHSRRFDFDVGIRAAQLLHRAQRGQIFRRVRVRVFSRRMRAKRFFGSRERRRRRCRR